MGPPLWLPLCNARRLPSLTQVDSMCFGATVLLPAFPYLIMRFDFVPVQLAFSFVSRFGFGLFCFWVIAFVPSFPFPLPFLFPSPQDHDPLFGFGGGRGSGGRSFELLVVVSCCFLFSALGRLAGNRPDYVAKLVKDTLVYPLPYQQPFTTITTFTTATTIASCHHIRLQEQPQQEQQHLPKHPTNGLPAETKDSCQTQSNLT